MDTGEFKEMPDGGGVYCIDVGVVTPSNSGAYTSSLCGTATIHVDRDGSISSLRMEAICVQDDVFLEELQSKIANVITEAFTQCKRRIHAKE